MRRLQYLAWLEDKKRQIADCTFKATPQKPPRLAAPSISPSRPKLPLPESEWWRHRVQDYNARCLAE